MKKIENNNVIASVSVAIRTSRDCTQRALRFVVPSRNDDKFRGFTLIELLTVIAILSVIGGIVVSVLTVTLRGTKKADQLEVARQNGDTALSQIVKGIRYAKSLDDPTSCVGTKTVSSVTITSLDTNTQTVYACSVNTITSNGSPLVNTNALSVTNCSFVCSQTSLADPPNITILYTLGPKTASNFVETNFTLPFQSSVTMRNYSQ
jgi:prepilin-type N-terminal cleavage/methylation domain-containing protein